MAEVFHSAGLQLLPAGYGFASIIRFPPNCDDNDYQCTCGRLGRCPAFGRRCMQDKFQPVHHYLSGQAFRQACPEPLTYVVAVQNPELLIPEISRNI